MKNLIKFIKPYWKVLLIVIIFLFVQAFSELSLPGYTSDIIDTGIQNKGVEHPTPLLIRESEYEALKGFMTADESELWEAAYNKADNGIYALKDASDDTMAEYDEAFLMPILMRYAVTKMDKKQAEAMTMMAQSEEALVAVREEMADKYSSMGDTMLKSMAIAYSVTEYEKAQGDLGSLQMSYLKTAAFKMMLIVLLMVVADILVNFFSARIGAGLARNLREKVFNKVVSFSNGEINKFSTASLITRSTNDIQQIQTTAVILVRMVIYGPILCIGGIILVLQSNASMLWVIGLGIVCVVTVAMVVMMVALPKFKKMQILIDKVNLVSREILTGIPVIRAFTREKKEEQRFDGANVELTKTQLFTGRVMAGMMPGMMLVMNGLSVLIIWVGAHKIDLGTFQVGEMTAFLTYAMIIVMSFLMLSMVSMVLPRAIVAANRVDEVLSTDLSITDKENPIALENVKGEIVCDHVSFCYPDSKEKVLEDITFTAKPGQVTAIIGSTGSGKSTIAQLLMRFYDVSSGKITLDGMDIRDLSLSTLRNAIGYVPQKTVLFSGTIDSNLRFGKDDASVEELRKAAGIAQAIEFIESNEEGLDRSISQGGGNVSGGQKQRLSIARALVKNPKILIFDDSFSALDFKTDAALRQALFEAVGNATVVIIAQRISTILHADQILVLDEGKIVGCGNHQYLMEHCQTYQQIAMSQLSEKELDFDAVGGKEVL